MTIYYPQACVVLKIMWEDFKTGDAALQAPYTLQVLPKRVQVNINSYREADTFEMEIDYRNFPFDPRLIRNAVVSIHIENMASLTQDNDFLRISPKDPEGNPSHNRVFLGFVDDAEINMDGSRRNVVLKGRDYTSIYIDAPWAGEILDLGKPVDQILRDIIGKLKATGDITLDDRTGSPLNLPNLGKFAPDLGEYSSKRGARKKESFWGVMQDIADRAGLILYMELDKLVLTLPNVLYSSETATQFIWGHNLSRLSMKRRVGRIKGFNIRIRSVVDKDVITVDIPFHSKKLPGAGDNIYTPKLDANGNPIKGDETVAPFITFSVPNIASRDHLITYGERIFEETGRQQLEGSLTTKDMESFAGTEEKTKVDLTKLRNGAAIRLEINPRDMAAMRRLTTTQAREQYLVLHNYDQSVAAVIARNFGRFDTALYLREARMSFSSDDGWQLEIGWINRIETSEANR
jgi:hypothetical protein